MIVLKILLGILLGILVLLFLIMLIRVEVLATYNDSLTLTIKILFFRIKVLPSEEKPEKKEKKKKPEKPKSKKKEKPKEEKEKKPSLIQKLKEKKGLSGLLSLLWSVVEIALGALKGLISHVVIKKFDLGILLAGEDAASVAESYGKLCSVVYPAVNIITNATVCRDYNVGIEPTFDPDRKTETYADVHAYLRIIFAVWEALKAGVKIIIARIKL